MKITSSQKNWIANGVASGVFLLCAVAAVYCSPFEPQTKIALCALSIILLLGCFYLWQPQEGGKEKLGFWVRFSVFGVAWTFVGLYVGSVIYRVSYVGLLTFQAAAWEGLGWMGPLAIGPFLVVLGLVCIMRKVMLNLLNN
jgi:hypothetical protein